MKDYYNTLGVARDAAHTDIKHAYRRLASQHHPDKGGSTERFQQIQEAYAVLSDADQRQKYDNPHATFEFTPDQANFDFDGIFRMFGAKFGDNARATHPTSRMQLWIGLRDVARGGPKQIAVSSHQGRSNLEIDIPVGIDDGSTVRYSGLAPGGGDLVVTFRIKPEPGWERQGSNVIQDVVMSVWDLILGTELTVESPDGRHIIIQIPEKSQPGSILRIPGYGLRTFRQTTVGDLMVRLQSWLPPTISIDLLDAIRRERGH